MDSTSHNRTINTAGERGSRKRSHNGDEEGGARKRQAPQAGSGSELQLWRRSSGVGDAQGQSSRSTEVDQNYGSHQAPATGADPTRRRKEKMPTDSLKDPEVLRPKATSSKLRMKDDRCLQEKKKLEQSLDEANKTIRDMRHEGRERGVTIRELEGELLEMRRGLLRMERSKSELVGELEAAHSLVRKKEQSERELMQRSEQDIREMQRENREMEGKLRKREDELWESEKSESKLAVELETAKNKVRMMEERERELIKKSEDGICNINHERKEREDKLRKMQDELWEMEKSESSLVAELETAKDQVRGIEERERTSTKKFEEDIRKINRESQEKEGKLRKMQNDLLEREKSASIQVAELMIAKNQARKKEEGEGASVKNYQGDIRKIQRESKEREDKLARRLDIAEKSEKTLREELKVAREKIGGMELREKKLKAAMGSVADLGDALGLETRREEVSQRGSTNDEGIMIDLLGTSFDKMELE